MLVGRQHFLFSDGVIFFFNSFRDQKAQASEVSKKPFKVTCKLQTN